MAKFFITWLDNTGKINVTLVKAQNQDRAFRILTDFYDETLVEYICYIPESEVLKYAQIMAESEDPKVESGTVLNGMVFLKEEDV